VIRYRASEKGKTAQISAGKITLPVFLRLSRSDRQFRAYTSPDGKLFTLAAQLYDDSKPDADAKPQGVDMDTGTLVGIAISGGTLENPAAAVFDQVMVRGLYDTATPAARQAEPPRFAGGVPDLARAGLLLHTGTLLAKATVASLETDTITVKRPAEDGAGVKTMTLQRADLASVRYRDLPGNIVARLPDHPVGVLLSSGDFMEGDISKLTATQVEVNNITLGLSTFALDTRVSAIYFRDASTTPGGYRVRLADGTVVVCRQITTDKDMLVLDDFLLGPTRVAAKDLISIQGNADKSSFLVGERPTKVDGPAGTVVEAVSYTDVTSSFWLSAGASGARFEQGLIAPSGSSVTYKIDPKVKKFTCRVSVPDRLSDKAAVRFIVEADGKELARSEPATSRSVPQQMTVALADAKSLTLRVEAAGKNDLPSFGLWAIPMLMR
jgi:hypothetical protein